MLLHLPRMIEEVHLVILVSDFIRKTASPGLDRIELMPLFVVAIFADIHFHTIRDTARSSLEIAGVEHDKAFAFHFFNVVVPISSSLDDFIVKKVLIDDSTSTR